MDKTTEKLTNLVWPSILDIHAMEIYFHCFPQSNRIEAGYGAFPPCKILRPCDKLLDN